MMTGNSKSCTSKTDSNCLNEKNATYTVNDESLNDEKSGGGSHFMNKLNLKVLDGLRCILSYWVVQYHTHYFNGAILLRESPCNASISRAPILGDLFFRRPTFHMTLFWLISGFLCEYQLHQMLLKKSRSQQQREKLEKSNHVEVSLVGHQNQPLSSDRSLEEKKEVEKFVDLTISWKEYALFFLNRVLRLYPLYIILQTIAYGYSIVTKCIGRPSSYTLKDFIYSLFFIKRWNLTNVNMAGVCWSVQVNVHGFIAIIILFAVTYKYTYLKDPNRIATRTSSMKRLILVTWYIISILHVISYRPFKFQRLSIDAFVSTENYGTRGIDTLVDTHLIDFGIEKRGGRQVLYPHFDFDNEMIKSIRAYLESVANDTYFRSIFNHGSAVMLGSLLYLNLYERNGRPFYPKSKLLLCFLCLYIGNGWHFLSGLAMYFLIEALLTFQPTMMISNCYSTKTMKQNHDNNLYYEIQSMQFSVDAIMVTFVRFLSNPIFQALSPYTYGIYLFHFIVVGARNKIILPKRYNAIKAGAAVGIDACTALENAGLSYNKTYIFKESLVNFVITFLIAVMLHRMIEKPLICMCKRWLNDKVIMRDSHKTLSSPTRNEMEINTRHQQNATNNDEINSNIISVPIATVHCLEIKAKKQS